MNFGFSEDQTMIRDSAKGFVTNESSLERIRELRDSDTYFSEELYTKMAENGWIGAIIPEEYGGIGLGYVDLICIMEEFGTGLMPEPILSSQILGGNTILHAGNEAQKQEWLPKISEGTVKFTLACYELAGRYNLAHVETTAEASGHGYTLNGTKAMVTDASCADRIIVSARTAGSIDTKDGISLFVFDPKATGVTLTEISTMDHQSSSMLALENVSVSAENVLGGIGDGYDAIVDSVGKMNVGLCAEMVGGMGEALRMTVEYSQERVQFERVIGSFQALKHKAADMYVDVESARSNMYLAAMAVDNDLPEVRKSISGAKAMCSDNYLKVTKEAIQLHGGVGYTDEHVIHFYYKRAQASATTFGDAMYHREKYMEELFKLDAATVAV
jgi:alkylation response protein AidB-like acyl-CoA dehydrogenase